MIIVDYSGIAMSAVFSQKSNTADLGLLRHQILNCLRLYNIKYRAKFGNMVIACDGGSWRKDVFAEYKAARSVNREASSIDWNQVWTVLNTIQNEIKNNLPYKVIRHPKAEADDVISVLVESTQEFGQSEPVLIVSEDKDFIQLQKYSNVEQFSPRMKKRVTDKHPRKYLIEHILRGDPGDGVPNVLSADDVFVSGVRQTPLRKSIIAQWTESYSKLEEIMDESTYRNFIRNRQCIDLSYTPPEICENILKIYNDQPKPPNSRVLTYLITSRCRQLIECASDFFPPKH